MMRFSVVRSVMVAFTAVAVMSSCATPRETQFYQRIAGTLCDKLFQAVPNTQINTLNLGFYYGQNPGECRAVYDEVLGDNFARTLFVNRTFNAQAADECAKVIEALTADDMKKALSARITAADYGGDQTLANNAKSTLGQGTYTCVTEQGSCLAEPVCNAFTPLGKCGLHLIAPINDSTVRTNEQTAVTNPANVNVGCGSILSLIF